MLIVVALDDVTGEMVAYVIEKLLENGANNVHVSQTVTKKGRTGQLFFIDVNEEHFEEIREIIMTELGSTGFNIIKTQHHHAHTKVTKHLVILKAKQKTINETVRITSSFSPKGKLVKLDPNSEDLRRIIQKTKQNLGLTVTFRELKTKIKNTTKADQSEIQIKLPI